MKTKVIIFDKDGTLLDFDSFWVPVTRFAVGDLLHRLGCSHIPVDDVLAALGHKDGVTDITGVFCFGTFAQVGQVIHDHLTAAGCPCDVEQVAALTVEAFHANADKAQIRPTCADLPGLLTELRALGLKLAVATTDDPFTTEKCLQTLGIGDCFEVVYTDDGVCPPKPDPHCIRDLCRRLSVSADEVVMVGDTLNDMKFARNGGVRAVGVARDGKNRAILAGLADAVIGDISHILSVIP